MNGKDVALSLLILWL